MNHNKKPSLDEQIKNLPLEKHTDKDLWTGIEYAISLPMVEKSRAPIYGIAASLLIIGLVGYVSFQSGLNSSGQTLITQLSEQHFEQKQALLTSLSEFPTTTQNWQQQLTELDEAALAIKKALENEPNNAALLKMLKRVYEQQITLIERVHVPTWQQI